jgi:hypothetical protein
MASRQDSPLPQFRADGVVVNAVAADEMTRRERDEAGLFVHLPEDIAGADDAERADVEQAHFDAFFGERHPGIDVGGIVVVVDEDVVAAAEGEAGGNVAQGERGRADERDFVWLAVDELGGEFAAGMQGFFQRGDFLVAGGGGSGVVGDGADDALGQGADAGVAEKDAVLRHGKFAAAQVFVREEFGQRHAGKLDDAVDLNNKGTKKQMGGPVLFLGYFVVKCRP